MKCTFCTNEATRFYKERGTMWPACRVHAKLEQRYCLLTSKGPKLTKRGAEYARNTGVDESIIMLYSYQSSTNPSEKSPGRRIGGSTKSESKHLTKNPRHISTGDSVRIQDVGSNPQTLQQHTGKKTLTRVGSAGLRERKDDPY